MARSYKVMLRDKTEVTVSANDVDLDCNADDGSTATPYWNFLSDIDDEESVTVAAFPFSEVLYIRS